MKTRPIDPRAAADAVATDRWASFTRVDESTGCIVWQGFTSAKGYALFMHENKRRPAHRYAWVAANGQDVPDELVIDHLCRNASCVNPDHLEAVESAENTRRGGRRLRTHCPRGHALVEGNLSVSSYKNFGKRGCLTCERERARRIAGMLREAAVTLGITQEEYLRRYGRSIRTLTALTGGVS